MIFDISSNSNSILSSNLISFISVIISYFFSSFKLKFLIVVSTSIVERSEIPIIDITRIPPFTIKQSLYFEKAILSKNLSIMYIRNKVIGSE